jgi:hypothetical protein
MIDNIGIYNYHRRWLILEKKKEKMKITLRPLRVIRCDRGVNFFFHAADAKSLRGDRSK